MTVQRIIDFIPLLKCSQTLIVQLIGYVFYGYFYFYDFWIVKVLGACPVLGLQITLNDLHTPCLDVHVDIPQCVRFDFCYF